MPYFALLDHLYLHLANRANYTGGSAGSATFQPMPCLFDSLRIVQNGVLLLLLYCAGRRMHPGLEAATTELRGFTQHTGAQKISGALAPGKIGGSTVHGYPLFDNAALLASFW